MIIKWIKNLIGYQSREEKQKRYQDYLDFVKQTDLRCKQENIDMDFEEFIFWKAADDYRAWVHFQNNPNNIIQREHPDTFNYYIYDESIAKYKNANIDELVNKKFEEFKAK